MPDKESGPVSYAPFTVDEYDLFTDAVDEALGLFGAEGQDIDEGYVELAAGDPEPEVHEFALGALAARCLASPTHQWPDLCARQVMDWAEGQPQRTWLRNSRFDEVEDQLEVWLTGADEPAFEGDPEGPEQPFSVQMADGLYVRFLAEAPELDDAPAMRSFVTNAAVHAWHLSAEDLLESARRRLRQLPPPIWDLRTVSIQDNDGNTVGVDLYFGSAPHDSSTPVSAWALMLDEFFSFPPEKGTLAAMPHRHLLIVGQSERTASKPFVRAFLSSANLAYQAAVDTDRVSSTKYLYHPQDGFKATGTARRAPDAGSP